MTEEEKKKAIWQLQELNRSGVISDSEMNEKINMMESVDCQTERHRRSSTTKEIKPGMDSGMKIALSIILIILAIVAIVTVSEIPKGDEKKSEIKSSLDQLMDGAENNYQHANSASGSANASKATYSSTSYISKDDEATAISMAQELVKKELKSPSTASFPWDFNAYTVTRKGDQFTVKGYVDAQNSFGAKLRNKFEACFTLEKVGTKYKGTKIYTLIYE